jgi:bifunctional non-homologous end joining protein LigD
VSAVEPLPEHIVPMLAKLADLPADDDRWGYEIKWDGVRVILYSHDSRVRLESRNLLDVTSHYPELHGIGPRLGSRPVVLDGEVVAFDDKGRPSFQHLQGRMHLSGEAAVRRAMAATPVVYMIFDVLHLDGHATMPLPYTERRAVLYSLGLTDAGWQTPGYEVGGGLALLDATASQGLEGLVAKRLDSTYEPGRRPGTWRKVKRQQRQELVIGGWFPGEGKRHGRLGAMLVGHYDLDGRLVYAGKVGTGFSDAELDRLGRLLAPLERSTSPFQVGTPARGARFVEPALVGEFEFTEWTRDGTLRHPSYKGLRDDKDPRDVVREDA